MSSEASKQSKPRNKARQEAGKTLEIPLLAWSLGLATLLGGVVSALTLLPRVSVTPSDPVDPTNTFSASFTISNNNFIPLRHVDAGIGIWQMLGKDVQPQEVQKIVPFEDVMPFERAEWRNHNLDMDERFTITPNELFTGHVTLADIGIIVTYQPWILPWSRKRIFRFKTVRQSDGTLHWYSEPMQ